MTKRANLCASVALAGGFGIVVATGTLAAMGAGPEGPVLAVFSPGTSIEQSVGAVQASGARITGRGTFSWVVAVDEMTAGERAALRRAGVMLLLDADMLQSWWHAEPPEETRAAL